MATTASSAGRNVISRISRAVLVETRLMGPLHGLIDILLVLAVVTHMPSKPKSLIERQPSNVRAPARYFLKIGERYVFTLRVPFVRRPGEPAKYVHAPIRIMDLVALHVIAAGRITARRRITRA